MRIPSVTNKGRQSREASTAAIAAINAGWTAMRSGEQRRCSTKWASCDSTSYWVRHDRRENEMSLLVVKQDEKNSADNENHHYHQRFRGGHIGGYFITTGETLHNEKNISPVTFIDKFVKKNELAARGENGFA